MKFDFLYLNTKMLEFIHFPQCISVSLPQQMKHKHRRQLENTGIVMLQGLSIIVLTQALMKHSLKEMNCIYIIAYLKN